MSENYQNSRYTRAEAHYVWRRNRPIIPLQLHREYKPTGWLGMTVTDLYYINFSSKVPFADAYKELLDQIAKSKQPTCISSEKMPVENDEQNIPLNTKTQRLSFIERVKKLPEKIASALYSPQIEMPEHDHVDADSTIVLEKSLYETLEAGWASQKEDFQSKTMNNWTEDDVKHFLNIHKLDKFVVILNQGDGNELYRYYRMSEENNIKLFELMRGENSDIKLSDYTRFTKYLKKHAEQSTINN